MTIYFVNGNLKDDLFNVSIPEPFCVVDAADGYSRCMLALTHIKSRKDNINVVTNFIEALDSDFCYNGSTNRFDLFIISKTDGQWHNIQEFTSRELRCGHNLVKLYQNEEFQSLD